MKYCCFDNVTNEVLKSFKSKRDCFEWLLDGVMGTEGAERDHWVSMLSQFKSGKKTLCYWD